ncbi:MAG: hypothetical protein IT460_16555 [Planctomycetes bacterium]|nr:hypothetical protein [Planctomycetota bacterium]
MGEAASLPPDHPQRVEMQAEVSRLGAWAEAEWLALLEEGERWRLELVRVEVPEGLEDRLLSIPAEVRVPTFSRLLGLRRGIWAAVAAALLVAVGAWLALGQGGSEPSTRPLDTLAMLAMNDHLDTHSLDVTSGDPKEVEAGLYERIPFEIRWPDFRGAIRLEGGRRCTLGSHPVCFTTWRKDGVRFTLLQIRRRDFGLPEHLAPTTVTPKGAAAGKKPLDVLIWTEGDVGWALVADDPSALATVRPGPR